MSPKTESKVRVIACGAVAREIMAVLDIANLGHISLTCLPAILHNHPDRIPNAVETEICQARNDGYSRIFVAYADCGTGGLLDKVCEKYGVERIAGPHCYSFLVGNSAFEALGDTVMTSFFVTDFLARQFDAFVTRPLGLDKHPELRDAYFGNYEKLVYLAQTDNDDLDRRARKAADFLGLSYERRRTGYGDLETAILQTTKPRT